MRANQAAIQKLIKALNQTQEHVKKVIKEKDERAHQQIQEAKEIIAKTQRKDDELKIKAMKIYMEKIARRRAEAILNLLKNVYQNEKG